MLSFLTNNYTWILVLILLINMSQRRIPGSGRKRVALIWIAAITLVYYMIVVVSAMFAEPWPTIGVWGGLALMLVAIIVFRDRVWPFRLHCRDCRKRLKWEFVIGHDDNLCQDCHDKRHPEEAEARKERERQPRRRRPERSARGRSWRRQDPARRYSTNPTRMPKAWRRSTGTSGSPTTAVSSHTSSVATSCCS